jgi:hypothetical protein
MGRFGAKTKAGWYRYGEDRRTPAPDPLVHNLIAALSAEAGVARRPIDAQEIRERALAAMINEACAILDEGIAARASPRAPPTSISCSSMDMAFPPPRAARCSGRRASRATESLPPSTG